MKIKNFNINANVLSKAATFVLAGSLVSAALTGCGDKSADNLLEGTILEGARVITYDDVKDIATPKSLCNGTRNSYHYKSAISGGYFADEKCTHSKTDTGHAIQHCNIIDNESIIAYLTTDDLTKAYNGELTDEDIIAIISRAVEPENEIGAMSK